MPDSPAAPRPSTDPDVRAAHARDASGLEMIADAVARPRTREDTVELLREAYGTRTPVTPAGNQTSTTGASITDRGWLLSMRAMDRVLDLDVNTRTVRVEPGVTLGALDRLLAPEGVFFPPDPTSEEDATVGGAIACNASGARTLRYGPTRGYVNALVVAMADGSVIEVRRSSHEKNTVGYALAHQPVDWFVGSEGTLGVVLEAELRLLPRPEGIVGLWLPFGRAADLFRFIVETRRHSRLRPRCLEFFDDQALSIVRGAAGDPGWTPGAAGMVYVEDDAASVDLDEWLALAERSGASVDGIRVADGESALREARRLRHSVPAHMNERGAAHRAAGGRKVSTDWAVPFDRLEQALEASAQAVARHGAPVPVSYGHAGNGHPHQNFIARDREELALVERAVEETLAHVIALGGTVAAEHGIGKLKRKWLPLQVSALELAVMESVKRTLDPEGLLSPGNVL